MWRKLSKYLVMTLVGVNEFLWQEATAGFDWLVEIDGLVLGWVEIIPAEIIIRIIDMQRSCFTGDINLLRVIKRTITVSKTSSSCSLGGLLAAFLSLRFSSMASISSLSSPLAANSSLLFSSL